MLTFDVTPFGRNHGLLIPIPAKRLLHLIQQSIEILLPEEPVSIHRMPVSNDLARPLPITKRVRGHAEIVGCR
jgi:hypothetical protein